MESPLAINSSRDLGCQYVEFRRPEAVANLYPTQVRHPVGLAVSSFFPPMIAAATAWFEKQLPSYLPRRLSFALARRSIGMGIGG